MIFPKKTVTIIFILVSLLTAYLYITASIYISNSELINTTIHHPYPLVYKITIIKHLYQGLPVTLPKLDLFLLLTTAFLTGINTAFILTRLNNVLFRGKMNIVIGGSTLLGLATGGCAACGLPLLAFLGIGGSIYLLPFKGYELSFLAIFLLLISGIIFIRNSQSSKDCKTRATK
jgi:hypothetical protein